MVVNVDCLSDCVLSLWFTNDPRCKFIIPLSQLMFADEYGTKEELRPGDAHGTNFTVTLTENRRLTPDDYERNVFHLEMDIRVWTITLVLAQQKAMLRVYSPYQ